MRQSLMIPSGHELTELYLVVVNYMSKILSIIYVCLVCPSFFTEGPKNKV